MPSQKSKGSKGKGSKGSKKGSKGSKKGSKGSKGGDEPVEEPEFIVPVPEGTMHRRLRYLLQSTLKTDIDFVVGPTGNETTIKGHKCMLSAESPMFEKLFADCDEWKNMQVVMHEADAAEIRQKDAEIEAELAHEAATRSLIQQNDSKGSKKGSKGNKKGSKDSNKGSKGSKKKSPKTSGGKNKSPKGVSKGSKSKGSKGSKGKGSKLPDAPPPKTNIDFLKDEIIGPDIIRVQDVHPLGFFRLLRYIYYDEMVFTGIIGTIRTLYAARKYCFYDLARACVNYLENNVCIEHIFCLLNASIDFHEDRLTSLCMRLICNDTFEVINREDFKDIKKEMIIMILEQDVLNAREIEIFDRVMHWAENECDRLQITVTATNQRIALGNHNLALIRFPTILSHEFATHVVESKILRTDEIIPILQYFITGRKPNLPYSCQTRRRPCLELEPLDNASIAFSDQTDLTFLGHDGKLRRSSSFRDLLIPCQVLPPVKTGLVQQRQRTGSPPARFHVGCTEFCEIEENLRHLKHLFLERNQFEWTKQNMSVMTSHYR